MPQYNVVHFLPVKTAAPKPGPTLAAPGPMLNFLNTTRGP